MREIVNISFPGLGIDEFSIRKIAFTLFGKLDVRWYGILITTGILLAVLYTVWRGKRNEKILSDDVIDVALVTVVLGVIGARLYYVLTDSGNTYESFLDVIAIWQGGLGIYGGIIGGCLGIVLACRVKKLSWRKLLDMAAPGVMLAQAIGRFGNFCNGEAYGSLIGETTAFTFFGKEHILNVGEGSLFHTLRMGLSPNMYSSVQTYYFHPTFLYESLWNLLGFALVNLFYKHKRMDGQVFLFYVSWYGFGRMFIEGLRTDSLLIPGTDLRISQCVGLLCFVAGLVLFVLCFFLGGKKTPKVQVAEGAQENGRDDAPAGETEEGTEEQEDAETDASAPEKGE
ncbi:MAG: prolipoprotein diacylglyceryl transferase [Clostridia bacterium]|nr:prolipoprotein diacylglyceryl transferase [Clostridia bacterium]